MVVIQTWKPWKIVQCDNNLGPLQCAFTQQLKLYKMCQCLKTNGKEV